MVTSYSASHIELGWTASTDNVGVAGYRIFRDGSAAVFAVSPFNSYVDHDVGPGETHSYRVCAFDAVGNRSNRCDAVSGTTDSDTTPPSQPLNLLATVSP